MDWQVPAVALPAVVAAIGALGALLTSRQAFVARNQAEHADRRLREEQWRALQDVSDAVVEESSDGAFLAALVDMLELEMAKSQRSPETEELLADLMERIRVIEERLPARSTVDKIASVNDAIMATKIEALEKDLARISDGMLTKWDVATIVFAVLAGVSVLVGLIAGAIKLFA